MNFSISRPVLSNVSPGFIQSLIPSSPPENAEDWTEIMRDMDRVIMPGVNIFLDFIKGPPKFIYLIKMY